jgi:RNA polymerase sigma-70 factor (ECF subfamily)
MSDSSNLLCERAREGNLAAASELVALHYQKLFAFFRRLVPNDEDAADLTQKTFARVWSALPSYRGRSSFSTWLHGIGRNVYVDWRRRDHRADDQTDQWWENCVAEGPSPFEDAAEREQATRLHALVGRLDDEKKEVVHLHYYQGLSLKETAEALEIATSTVKYRLREALSFLRDSTRRAEAIMKPQESKGRL